MSILLDTDTVSMGELLGNSKIYRVPPFQRDYSWREEHWEDLWNDIALLLSNEEQRHYMGSVVLQRKGDKEYHVIDGQQRLTTLSLVVISVIKRLRELVDSGVKPKENAERVEILRRTYLGDKDPKSLYYSSKLFLNANNDNFYQSYVLQLKTPPSPRRLNDTDKLLWQAFQYCYKQLGELRDIVEDGAALTGFLTEEVARKLLFIKITVDDELSAYTVFETLNARGIELTSTDLLKNYLFSLIRSDHDLRHVQSQWQRIANAVGTDRFPEFLRHYINSRQPLIRSQRLFRVVKDSVKEGTQAVVLLDELEKEAYVYSALFNAGHELWNHSRPQRRYIRILRIFNVKQLAPLLLASYRHFDDADFTRVLKLCVVISFRYNVISGLNTNELERAYNQASVAIHKNEVQTPAELFQILKSIYVNDEKFEQDFIYKSIKTSRGKKLVRYILYEFEHDAGGSERDFLDDPGTIEHILPENPGGEWDETFPFDVQDRFIYRLGNYTILEESINKEVGRGSFPEKRKRYQDSVYKITQAMRSDEWTMDALTHRQEHMAKRAVHIWRSDFS